MLTALTSLLPVGSSLV